MKTRNINIDFIKCVAVLSVLSVHFFSNTGFYNKKIDNFYMYLLLFFRTFFMICVPLFLITTGYLMNKKEIEKRYYLGIFRVVIIYVLDAILYLGYHSLYLKEFEFTLKTVIRRILQFEIGFSWYIEMYIGLFLIIPFLNLIYNNLDTKLKKKLLLFTMLIMTSFQGVLNVEYNLIPDWWIDLYPITYYYLGCYLKEYNINVTRLKNIFYILIMLLASTIFNIIICNNGSFVYGIHNDYPSIFNVLVAVFIFELLKNIDFSNLGTIFKKVITNISNLSLGIYLTSSIVDNFIFNQYFNGNVICSFSSYIKIIPITFLISTILSIIINFIYKVIDNYLLKKIFV